MLDFCPFDKRDVHVNVVSGNVFPKYVPEKIYFSQCDWSNIVFSGSEIIFPRENLPPDYQLVAPKFKTLSVPDSLVTFVAITSPKGPAGFQL